MRLEHITRTTRTFCGYCNLVVPARSAPVYVHQLQAMPNIFGSNDIYFPFFQNPIYFVRCSKVSQMRGVQSLRSEAYILIRRSDVRLQHNKADGRFSTAYSELHQAFHFGQHLLVGKVTGNNGRCRTDGRAKTAAFTQSLINFRNSFISIK
jgi:hypothetical protein